MRIIKGLFRLNFIRNHYIRFGIKGVLFYFRLLFSKRSEKIQFKHGEYKQPIYLRVNSSDIDTFYQVLFNLEYEIETYAAPKVIIDLGANIGLASIYFLNKYPKSKVIALEPEKENYKLLEKNMTNYTNFFSYNKGVWNRSAFLEIVDNGIGNWGYSVNEVLQSNNNTIEAISINQIISDHSLTQIDVLKIDIEGSEIELFLSNYELWLPITKLIIIELHDWMREGCSKQFFSTMVKYNFKLTHKGENLVCYLKK
jgi:FkbM family methyltransferase